MRRYTVITPLAVRGRPDPLPAGAPVEMDETIGDKLVDKGILARVKDGDDPATAIETDAMVDYIRTLEQQLTATQVSLASQIALTQAAEERARQAEERAEKAVLDTLTLRAQAAPPPAQEPPPEPPPAVEAKKPAKK